jgi:hypothetical protein
MRPPSVKRITVQDLGEFGLKLAPFLTQFNNFSQQVVDIFSGRVGVDNIDMEIATTSLVLNPFTPVKISMKKINVIPSIVLIGKINQVNPAAKTIGTNYSLEWETDGETITINKVNGTFVANAVYKMNLLIF